MTLVVGTDGTVATEHLGPMTVDDLDEAIDALGDDRQLSPDAAGTYSSRSGVTWG